MSEVEVCAVSTMMGRVTVRGSARRRRQISRPSMRGRLRSRMTMSGWCSATARRPFSPVSDGDDAVAGVLEDATEDAPDGSVVLDDCHAGSGCAAVGGVLQRWSLHCATTT